MKVEDCKQIGCTYLCTDGKCSCTWQPVADLRECPMGLLRTTVQVAMSVMGREP